MRLDLRSLVTRDAILPPAGMVWERLPLAISAALPLLAASVVCAWGVTRQPALLWLDFGSAGLLLAGGCLLASWLLPLMKWPGWMVWRSVAASFGLLLPALGLHVETTGRALLDPQPILLAPALVTGGLLALALAVVVWLAARPPFDCPATRAALLTPALLPIWLVGLIRSPTELAVIGAAGFTFAMCALAAFLTCLARGWLAWLPVVAALVAIWAAQLAVPPVAWSVSATIVLMLGAHLALALGCGILPFVAGLLLPWLRRRRAERLASHVGDEDEAEITD